VWATGGGGKVKEMKPDVKVGDVYTYEELLEIWCDVLQDEGEAVDRTEALAPLRTLRELWPPASH
jgi:hypothetical protein